MKFKHVAAIAALTCVTAGNALAQTPDLSVDGLQEIPPPFAVGATSSLHRDGWYPMTTPGLQRPGISVSGALVGDMMSAFYPPEARRYGQEGEAAVEMCVSANGRAEQVAILESSGFPSLDAVSVQMMKNMPLKAAQLAGKPVPVCGYVFHIAWSLPHLHQAEAPN